MSKIKYIHFFGTSCTAGGGFEFTNDNKSEKLNYLYGESGEELTRNNFSYPGQIQKLLNKFGYEIKVINHAKSGFGNELMYKLTMDIILDENFVKDENLFIYEFSYLGRKMTFSNTIEDYVTINYKYDFDQNESLGVDIDSVGYNYYEDSFETINKLDKLEKIFTPFIKETTNIKESEKLVSYNNVMFISFLNNMNLNYYYSQPPWFFENYKCSNSRQYTNLILKKNKIINYIFNNIKSPGFVHFFHLHDLTITKESNGLIWDNHMSLYGSKLVAQQTINFLIDEGHLDINKLTELVNVNINLKDNNII